MTHVPRITQMWDGIWPTSRPGVHDRLSVWRERILSVLQASLFLLGIAPLVTTVRYAVANQQIQNIALLVLIYLLLLTMLILRRPRFVVRVWMTAAILYGLALMSFFAIGPLGSYRIWLFTFTVIVGMLLGLRSGLVALALSLGTAGAMAALVITGASRWSISEAAVLETLLMTTVTFGSLSAAATLSLAALVHSLESGLRDQEAAVRELGEANSELRQEVDRRHAAERALRESEARYRLLVENQTDLVVRTDAEDRLTFVSPSYCATFGKTEAALLGHSYMPLVHAEDRAHTAEMLAHLDNPPYRVYFEQRAMTKVGWRWFGWMSTAVRDADGETVGNIGVGRDITERKAAEAALRQSEAMMRYIIKHDPNAMAVYDTDLHYIAVSDRYLQDYGLREEEVLGRHHYEVFPEMPQRWRDVHARVLAGTVESSDDDYFERIDGSITYTRWECRPWYHADGEIGGMIAYTEVTTERKLAELALRESEARFRSYVNHAPTGILISDAEDCLLDVNPAAATVTGYAQDDLRGMTIAELFPAGDGDLHAAIGPGQANDAPCQRELAFRRQDGTQGFVTLDTVHLGPERVMTFVADITQRKQAEAELAQQERLAAVGQLAAGIAHDFNNILAVIILYAQMDLANPALPSPFRSHMETIAREGQHAANLVEQILDFGRRGVLDPSPMDLVPFLKEQVRLLARTLPESIAVELQPKAPQAVAKADPTRMRQVIMNLAVNARDAMPDGGRLSLALEQVALEAEAVLPLPDLAPGVWVKLTVRDTGTGLSPEARRHLFEPFYTTKAPGAGTGLGLAQVYGIVKQHGGAIGAVTELDAGTAFEIYLPAVDDGPHPDPADDAGEAVREGQGETVLVVEDDEMLRQALVSTLEMLGYRSREAANGDAALALLAGAAGAEIDVVLSDLVMPELGGQALLQVMRERGFAHPVVIISGHPLESELRQLEAQGLSGWLMKPVSIERLAELLDEIL